MRVRVVVSRCLGVDGDGPEFGVGLENQSCARGEGRVSAYLISSAAIFLHHLRIYSAVHSMTANKLP